MTTKKKKNDKKDVRKIIDYPVERIYARASLENKKFFFYNIDIMK